MTDRRGTAFHEAAHAVVGGALGIPVERVTIRATVDTLGSCTHDGLYLVEKMLVDGGCVGPAAELWLRAALYFVTAGPLAEAHGAGTDFSWEMEGAWSDAAQAYSFAEELSPLVGNEVDIAPALRLAERATRLLVTRHWGRIEALTELLLTSETVEGEALNLALAGSPPLGARARFGEWFELPDWAKAAP